MCRKERARCSSFQFVRMERPTASADGADAGAWKPMNGDGPPNRHETILAAPIGNGSRAIRRTPMGTKPVQSANGSINWAAVIITNGWLRLTNSVCLALPPEDAIPALAARLADEYEPTALNAAYALAGMGESGVAALLGGLQSGDKDSARNAAYGLAAVGKPATQVLIEQLDNASEQVRGYAAFALGEIGLAGSDLANGCNRAGKAGQ